MKTRVMAAALWGICSFAQAGVVDFNPAYVVCNDDKGKQVACVDYLNPAPSYGTIAGLRNWTETDGRGIEPEDTVNDKGSANAETSRETNTTTTPRSDELKSPGDAHEAFESV